MQLQPVVHSIMADAIWAPTPQVRLLMPCFKHQRQRICRPALQHPAVPSQCDSSRQKIIINYMYLSTGTQSSPWYKMYPRTSLWYHGTLYTIINESTLYWDDTSSRIPRSHQTDSQLLELSVSCSSTHWQPSAGSCSTIAKVQVGLGSADFLGCDASI